MKSLAKGDIGSSLRDLIHKRDCRSKRASSYDVEGRNSDSWPLAEGETRVIADLEGAGCINHIWFTIYSKDRHYLRKMLVRMYWDGESEPSVESPVGDFFGVGHCKVSRYECAPLNMSASDDRHTAMNCFFAMPYNEGARIEIVNEAEGDGTGIYFYIDYEEYDEPLADDILRFHAKWRRECPTESWYKSDNLDPHRLRHYANCNSEQQLSGEGNYVILDAEGVGHYVGCNLSVHNLMGGWWGEGDDMIFIDGDKWPPSLHGTGSEDYFAHAWGMQKQSCRYNGVSLHEDDGGGKCTSYRYHIEDPICFKKSILVTIEHSHANCGTDDYSSVAYWYQTEPHKVWAPIPPAEGRVPLPDNEAKGRIAYMKQYWGKG